MANNNTSSGGASFCTLLGLLFIGLKLGGVITWLLGLLFIGLKLGGVITWPWIWVLCPLWIGLAIVLVVLGCIALVAAIVGICAGIYAIMEKRGK
jgi:hypothetical protein